MSNVKHIVMSRVHIIHMLRPFVSAKMLSAFFVVGAVFWISREVWVAKIVANMAMLTTPEAFFAFFSSAFLSTTFLVQVLSVVAVGAFVWLVRETLTAIRSIPRPAFV